MVATRSLSSATSLPRDYGRRCLLFGDSITAYNTNINGSAYPNNHNDYTAEGYLAWANRLMGQRLAHSFNKGVGGNTTTQMLARYDADVAANYAGFDIAFVLAGTNDIAGSVAAATIVSNIQTICTSLLAAGKLVCLMTILPRNAFSTAQMLQCCYINEQLRLYARTTPRIVLIDAFRDWADPTASTGYPATNVTSDGTHPTVLGGYLLGQRINAALSSIIPPISDLCPNAADYYDATNNTMGNRLPNPAFLIGTGGTLTNGQGTLVGNSYLQRYAGSWVNTEVTGSVNSAAAGFDTYPGKQQQLVVGIASGKSASELVQFGQTFTGLSAGDQIVFQTEVNVATPTNMHSLYIYIDESDGSNFPTNASDGWNANSTPVVFNPTGSFTFRTPPYTVQANSRTFYCNLVAGFNAVSSSAGATIKTQGWHVRKVN